MGALLIGVGIAVGAIALFLLPELVGELLMEGGCAVLAIGGALLLLLVGMAIGGIGGGVVVAVGILLGLAGLTLISLK
jgi:hypothetical protein